MKRFANLSTSPEYFRWKFVDDTFDFPKWVKKEEWVYDADTCDDVRKFWVVVDGDKVTYWEVKHSYWVDYDPEWAIHNTFEITEVEKSGVNEKYAKANLRFVV